MRCGKTVAALDTKPPSALSKTRSHSSSMLPRLLLHLATLRFKRSVHGLLQRSLTFRERSAGPPAGEGLPRAAVQA